MGIETKTPGVLIGELSDVTIKLYMSISQGMTDKVNKLLIRRNMIEEAIDRLISKSDLNINQVGELGLGRAIGEICNATTECYLAIDQLNMYTETGQKVQAGDQANEVHRLNQARNKAIQEVDRLLGFGDFTTTDKMYTLPEKK